MPEQTPRKSYVEQVMNECVHFTGLVNQTCAAGVRYDAVKVRREHPEAPAFAFAIPCLNDRCEGATCGLRRFYTREEAEAKERAMREETAHIVNARALISKDTGGKRGVAGFVECPKCSKRLDYSVSSYNGHVHARCETAGCLAWME